MSEFTQVSVDALKKHLVCDSCNPATAPPTIVVSSYDSPQTAPIRKPDDKCDDCHRNTYLLAAHLWSIAASARERRGSPSSHPRENEWPSEDIDIEASLGRDPSKTALRDFDLAMSVYTLHQAGCKNPSRIMQELRILRPSDADLPLYSGLRSVVDQASALVEKSNIDFQADESHIDEELLESVGKYIATLEGTLTYNRLWLALGEDSRRMYQDGQPGQPSLAEAVRKCSTLFDPIHFVPTETAMNGPHWEAVYNIGKGDVFHGFETGDKGASAMSEWLRSKVA
jgi:hypothetical protein